MPRWSSEVSQTYEAALAPCIHLAVPAWRSWLRLPCSPCAGDGGISIPSQSRSYLAPLSAGKIWSELKSANKRKSLETSYVVKLHNCWHLTEPQECFTFNHPNWPAVPNGSVDNSRYTCLKFRTTEAGTVHGFAGYFDTHLYGKVWLSTCRHLARCVNCID